MYSHFSEQGVIIDDAETRLYGILRLSERKDILIILLPFMAAGGTREGTQRLYVELSRSLLPYGISTFCVDLPPFGDSYDKHPPDYHPTSELYLFERYLDKIMGFIKENHVFREYILLSTSGGCIPVLNYSLQHALNRTILLSPDEYLKDIEDQTDDVKLSFQKMNNFICYYDDLMKVTSMPATLSGGRSAPLDVYCIYGEKDSLANSSISFWRELLLRQKEITCTYEVIPESNHSFFGWQFKVDIIQHIINWLRK